MGLIANFILPHPPVVIDIIGKEDIMYCIETKKSMERVAKKIENIKPDIIIVISPHGNIFSDAISINDSKELSGNLKDFGFPNIGIKKENSYKCIDEIYSEARLDDISIAKIDTDLANRLSVDRSLDHGVIVPLYYIEKRYKLYDLVHINYAGLSSLEHYKFGMSIKKACDNLNDKIVLISSGDLSHKLANSGPYSFASEGPLFDKKVQEYLLNKKNEDFILMDPLFCKKAGECGKKSIDVLLGTLDGYDYSVEKNSYEGPFGVGYGVFSFSHFKKDHSRKLFENIEKRKKEKNIDKRKNESELVKLARKAIKVYMEENRKINYKELEISNKFINNSAGVFVSIKKESGLRGCMGTIGRGLEDNIAAEVIRNSIQAAFYDPRFNEIEEYELEDLIITVDVLEKSEKVDSFDELNPEKYGIIVTYEDKRGLLLPNIEGINNTKEQISMACKKAGIAENVDYNVEKFLVKRYY